MSEPSHAAIAHFSALLSARFGLKPEPTREPDLALALAARMAASHSPTPEAYFALLDDPVRAPGELRAIAALVTIGETYFFRHPGQFEAFEAVALPELRALGRSARVLSAGSASGEELYSLAMLVREPARPGPAIELLGVDLNPEALERAREASYGAWSMRGVPEAVISRHFTRVKGRFQLDPAIAALARFEERNLTLEDAGFWRPGAFDVIFCRNVLIYFGPETIQAVIERLATALAPGGYLFLGPAESLRGVTDAFHLLHTHGCFYYQRKGGQVAPRDLQPVWQMGLATPTGWASAAPVPDDQWAEAIARAAERITRLASSVPATQDVLEPALESYRHERFGEALGLLGPAPTGDGLLLRAAVLTNMGRLEEAERACREAIARDELDPGAHYLLALCQDQAGEYDAARRHDEAAIYLDPAFAMPHLHLGLLAHKRQDRERACHALDQALALLAGESDRHVALFGGGFSRAALVAMARARRASVEAAP